MAFIRFNGLAVSWFVSVFLLPACCLVLLVVRWAWAVFLLGLLAGLFLSVTGKQTGSFCSNRLLGCLRGFRFVFVLPVFLRSFSLFPAVLAVYCCRGNIGIRFRSLC